jgi:demethylmenaquinone methyltransferase/2-methoxy-6-polyprenyl-1,4-benzoquinol methylase
MAAYYARRAGEYERIYARPERQAELRALEAWLTSEFAGRQVFEIACGTGWWTPHGAREARRWLATDLNPETLAIARSKALPACVEIAEADAYRLDTLAPGDFDATFAGFWWSHVPLQRLSDWLATLHARLQPGARIVFIDNLYVEGSSTPVHRRDEVGNTYQRRRLDDGSTHEVLKNFPDRDAAVALLGPRVTDVRWTETGHYWTLAYALQ